MSERSFAVALIAAGRLFSAIHVGTIDYSDVLVIFRSAHAAGRVPLIKHGFVVLVAREG